MLNSGDRIYRRESPDRSGEVSAEQRRFRFNPRLSHAPFGDRSSEHWARRECVAQPSRRNPLDETLSTQRSRSVGVPRERLVTTREQSGGPPRVADLVSVAASRHPVVGPVIVRVRFQSNSVDLASIRGFPTHRSVIVLPNTGRLVSATVAERGGPPCAAALVSLAVPRHPVVDPATVGVGFQPNNANLA